MSRTSYLRRPLAALLMAAALAASVVMAVVVLASPAWAATYTVTNNADSGAGSLRQAIIDANTTTGVADTINFELGSAASIPLTSAQLPTIADGAGLTIDGGSANIEINGQNTYRVFEVGNGAKLTLSNLTVVHGAPDGPGGAISNSGGTLEVSNSTLSSNFPAGGGGAIFNDSGTVTVSNSNISNNSAFGVGGGIANSNGTLEVSNSTLYGNGASRHFCCTGGGGIYNDGTATVSNSTLSSNGADFFGGGIANSRGTLEVNNSTLYGNSVQDEFAFGGGGIYNDGGTATFKNTIVANNPSASGGSCSGDFGSADITDGGYNLDSDNTCGFGTNNNSLSGVDPMLGPLADNGGPTLTHALLEGSPAIDKGNSFGESTDQRGLPRPSNFVGIPDASGGDGSDIGAFELQPDTTPPDTQAPKVISTVPRANADEVAPTANVRATFSEEMRSASVKNAFKLFKKGSTTQIAAQVSYDAATDRATLNPTNNLRREVTYKAVVSTVAKDVAGNRLDQEGSTAGLQQKVWFFEID